MKTRSEIMRAVKGRDTGPELMVRRLAHRMGYRFRLHRPDIPGKPDLCFVSRRAVIFVNGCFWHGHSCKRGARVPKANRDYWTKKISRNVARDAAILRKLRRERWRALVIWECETRNMLKLEKRIGRFLG